MKLDPQFIPLVEQINASLTRRQFFRKGATGLGVAALATLLGPRAFAAAEPEAPSMDAVWRIEIGRAHV